MSGLDYQRVATIVGHPYLVVHISGQLHIALIRDISWLFLHKIREISTNESVEISQLD